MKRFIDVRVICVLILFFLGSAGSMLSKRAIGAGQRFIFKNHTVEDQKTGLCWTRNANPAGNQMNWYDAVEYVKELNQQKFEGYSDWRLPHVEEMRKLSIAMMQMHGAKPPRQDQTIALVLKQNGFNNVHASDYWTATSSLFIETEAWYYSLTSGTHAMGSKWLYRYVWPVRWEQPRSYPGDSRDEAKKNGKKDRINQIAR